MLSDNEIDRINRFTNASSQGPWYFSRSESAKIEEHMAFMSDLLAKTTGDRLWYVSVPHQGRLPEDAPLVVAITGNGLLSQQNAQFITMAREVVPALVADRVTMRHLLPTLQLAYRKHVMDDGTVGWDELEEMMVTALAEAMGVDAFQSWLKTMADE